MGFLTTIVLHNDALHSFKEDPKAFGQAVLDAADSADYRRGYTSVPFQSYGNYIHAHPSRHADDHTVYVHSGNMVFNLSPYGKDFQELAERNPECLEEFIKTAKTILADATKRLKELRK